jgi:hypothetical protein
MKNLNKESLTVEFYSGGVKAVQCVLSTVSPIHIDDSLQLVRVVQIDSKILQEDKYICIEQTGNKFENLEVDSVICDKWVVPICQELGVDVAREFTDLNTLVRDLILYDRE